ncbi:hypothetical protein FI667_g11595, partial [Globisporangium splendens]
MTQKKPNGLRRIGAWCARLVHRASRLHAKHDAAGTWSGSPTDDESWLTTHPSAQIDGLSSGRKHSELLRSPSIEDDRVASYLEPSRRATATSSEQRDHQRNMSVRLHLQHQQEKDKLTGRSRASATLSSSSDAANRSVHDATQYIQAQRVTKRKLRALQYERSMQQPLNHIQIRRLVRREREDPVPSTTFVTIRKAKLTQETRYRLEMLGLRPRDSVPPWVPPTTDRWSCEPTIDDAWRISSSSMDQKMQMG